jgi:hypothetical protein
MCCVQLDWLRVKASPLLEPVLGHLTHNNPCWNKLILIAPEDINSDTCNKDFACRKALVRQCYKCAYAQKIHCYMQCSGFIFIRQLTGRLVPTARFIETTDGSGWLLGYYLANDRTDWEWYIWKEGNEVWKCTLDAPRNTIMSFNYYCLQNERSYKNDIYHIKT